MNVVIVSQCTKNAAIKTCRILDQFAERYGDRTWQTHITQQGLDMLRALLKRSARKNTAVACHWLRGRNRTDLLWIVGNAGRFSERGTVPTNTTEKDILRQQDENDWHTLQDIQILAAIAGLFHDFGKACQAFQAKLRAAKLNKKPIADAYRHEWVSLRLFQAFVGDDKDDHDWLSRLANLDEDLQGIAEKACLSVLIKDGIAQESPNPFLRLPPVAKTVGWLILSHHFLPILPEKFKPIKLTNVLERLDATWNNAQMVVAEEERKNYEKNKAACWNFEFSKKQMLPFSSKAWRRCASEWGKEAIKRTQLKQVDWLNDLFSLHMARLSLMLADHYYSSKDTDIKRGDTSFPLYANTDKDANLKQRLDEHLIGVAKYGECIVKALPKLEQRLPRVTRHKGFSKRNSESRFCWQNHAYDLACSLRDRTIEQGFFGINMASTGCGKTLANGRIMYGLANPRLGARFCIALGLRTLTLQTGEVYRQRLKLGEDDFAVLVGSSAVKELFNLKAEHNERQVDQNDKNLIPVVYGSESAEGLMPEDTYVHYAGSLEIGPLKQWIDKTPGVRSLIAAPILACTIDHFIGATEGTRGGKQIAPMLRLLTSDLVLDEPDDFDIADLPALARLVHWAGMLGSRVLLSSATLPPALVQGLYDAYIAGRKMFQKSRGLPGNMTNICCAWFDENDVSSSDHADSISFIEKHNQFVAKRVKKLCEADVYRRAIIKKPIITSSDPVKIYEELSQEIHGMLHELHALHCSKDIQTGKKVSFGLIRIANIDPLIDIAQYLFELGAKENHQIKLCCYHSRHPLLVRNSIERQLDIFLDRRKPEAIFQNKILRKILDGKGEDNVIFIVLASPVAEVGRDHDYDWAIVEPSSMRSIIQLAGRVKRHRLEICHEPNIYLLNKNIRSLKNSDDLAAYCWPGFEKKGRFLLNSHDLSEILTEKQYEIINAVPRIQVRKNSRPKENLADLEHARLQALMLDEDNADDIPANLWWGNNQATLSSILQKATRFRDSPPQSRFVLKNEGDGKNEELKFFKVQEGKISQESEILKNYLFHDLKIEKFGERIEAWGGGNYLDLLDDLAEKRGMDHRSCALHFGWVDLERKRSESEGKYIDGEWFYNHVFGLRRK